MLADLRPRMRFADITSLLALVLSLGGVAYAAGAVPFASKARFAFNSERVDGVRASATPLSGHLITLDHSRKLPQSVIPTPQPRVVSRTGNGFAAAYCPLHMRVTGGGGRVLGAGVLVHSGPQLGSNGILAGWAVEGSDSTQAVSAQVVCSS